MGNKFKKVKIIRVVALLFIGLLGACSEDFLIDANETDISADVVFTDDPSATAVVTGVYDGFQQSNAGSDPGLPNEYNVKGIFKMANNLTLDWQDAAEREDSDFFEFDLNPDSDIPTKIWPNHYRQIGRANVALDGLRIGVDNGDLSVDLGNRLIGEVLVLRAISYQYLAATYGGVPLMLSSSDDPFAARSTQDSVFLQIVSDMQEVTTEETLPWSFEEEKGRVTLGTAYAVLGNALMWLERYEEAVTAFQAIESGGVTSLESNYFDIHAVSNKNGVESLFELQFAGDGSLDWGNNDESTILQLFAMPTDITGGGGFSGIPTQELYDSFEPGDLRRTATVIAPGEEHPDPLIDIIDYEGVDINTAGTVADPWTGAAAGEPENPQRTGYWGVKSWRDPNIGGWGREIIYGPQNHIWIRYGEVLLSLAEAAFKSGQTGVAQATLDRVRERAWGGGTPPAMVVSMENILQEYRHELGGEFCLWPLIRRSGMAVEYHQANYGVTMPIGQDLVPIPNAVLSNNPNLEPNPSNSN